MVAALSTLDSASPSDADSSRAIRYPKAPAKTTQAAVWKWIPGLTK